MKKIVFIPSIEAGNGTGHLKRCCSWSQSLLYEGYLYIPAGKTDEFAAVKGLKEVKRIITDLDSDFFDMAVFDMRKSPAALIEKTRKITPFIAGIDEGGCFRDNFDYLIDTLPNLLKSGHRSNVSSAGFLGIPDRRNSTEINYSAGNKEYRNVLISFGGEDPAGLTEKLLIDAVRKNIFSGMDVSVVIGPLFRSREYIKNKFSFFNIIDTPETLESFILKADIIFTSFGITAYEALYSGKDVILVNPSEYHRKLSALAGFHEAGVIRPEISKIEKILRNPHLYRNEIIEKLNKPEDITELFFKAAETDFHFCPLCKKRGKVVERFHEKNYCRCGSCHIIYLQNIGKNNKEYSKSYFFEEYRKQYGKTYIEDFDNIAAASRKRLEIIKQYCKRGSVLDIGCAYGPFLDVMKKNGYSCLGIDVSEDAAVFVREKLGIKAIAGDFSIIDSSVLKNSSDAGFDILTMWYVIEHFKNTGDIIKKAGELLADNGIFAFSTPNLSGISALKNRKLFLEASPSDHYTVWNISSACRILRISGFRVLKIKCTGHHPERFPGLAVKIAGLKVLGIISRIFKLGDTFEIYAIKAGQPDE